MTFLKYTRVVIKRGTFYQWLPCKNPFLNYWKMWELWTKKSKKSHFAIFRSFFCHNSPIFKYFADQILISDSWKVLPLLTIISIFALSPLVYSKVHPQEYPVNLFNTKKNVKHKNLTFGSLHHYEFKTITMFIIYWI